MSTDLQIFISSTVDDLKEVRQTLEKRLKQPGRTIRCSESPEFLVEPGETSHEACLEAVRRSDVFVMLVNKRFGGEYAENKSITWREWEVARSVGLSPIVAIHQNASSICKKIYKLRQKLLTADPTLSISEQDKKIEAHPSLRSNGFHRPASIQRFVDELRKGHEDNWRLDWDGTIRTLLKHINTNLNVQASAAQRRLQAARHLVRNAERTLECIRDLTAKASLLVGDIQSQKIKREHAIQALVDVIGSHREPLFGFDRDDRHTLVVYQLNADKLHPIARCAHFKVPKNSRVWDISQSHVGCSVRLNKLMISGDIRTTDTWVRDPSHEKYDRENYVSVMTRPYYVRDGNVGGAVTLTSNRVDHFKKSDGPEVDAFDSVVSLVNILAITETI